MAKLTILFLVFFISVTTYADTFCGVILAENGLNVRTEPSLKSEIIYKLYQGETFQFHPDGYTEIFETIIDGNDTLKGQWIKIDLYSNDELGNPKEGYLFLTPKYAVEIYDCREFRHKLSEKDLYNSTYSNEAYDLKRKDSLKLILKLESYYPETEPESLEKQLLKENLNYYNVSKDTLFLKLDDGNIKKIISHSIGKNGNDDTREEFEYHGYFKPLNCYWIKGFYWETQDNILINKKDGDYALYFNGLPYISPDKKSMIIIEKDSYEGGTNVWLYTIENNNFKLIIGYQFSDWYIDGELFWISNNEILIPVRSINDTYNWVDKAYDNDIDAEKIWQKVKKQYIKLKLL